MKLIMAQSHKLKGVKQSNEMYGWGEGSMFKWKEQMTFMNIHVHNIQWVNNTLDTGDTGKNKMKSLSSDNLEPSMNESPNII
jgi:hypothetical protein